MGMVMTSQPSLIQQVSGLTCLKHAMYRNEAFSYACGSYSRSLLSHHTLPVPVPISVNPALFIIKNRLNVYARRQETQILVTILIFSM